MNYSPQEIMQFIAEEDVQFIRLAFCDIYGRPKNISIMPQELPRAFEQGIAFDGSAIAGFRSVVHSDLFLRPDPSTLSILPWRPEHGRVVRMYCNIYEFDGTPYEMDTRYLLCNAIRAAAQEGYRFQFGSESEFYLFERDNEGQPTRKPYDLAGYLDIAPDDKGENVRREICLTLSQMGITPESSHHEEGPGQNEIDFRHSDPLSAADNTMTLRTVVRTVAERNGVWADFSPRPFAGNPGNGLHINLSVHPIDREEASLQPVIAGVLAHIREMTLFLNPSEESYKRFGQDKAPIYISWSHENRSQLIRIPAAGSKHRRLELRSPDSTANPYLAYALMIHAAMEGIRGNMQPPQAVDENLYTADASLLSHLQMLPRSLNEAKQCAKESAFIQRCLPEAMLMEYRQR